jgi:ABC-2 type transport system ATP-binding protein
MTTTPALVAVDIEKRFGDRLAVSHLSLSLHRGEIVALLGPNGAGKTTTLRLLGGVLRPSRGRIELDGVAPIDATWPAARARIGFLTETPGLWDRLSVEDNLTVYARLYGVSGARARVGELLERFGLGARSGDPAATLSKGMRQKVALARALLHDPPIVLLDEPTAGLDPAMTRSVRELVATLRSEDRAVLLSTHNLDEADRVADRVAVLEQELVALDTPARLRERLGPRQIIVTLAGPAGPFVAAAGQGGAQRAEAEGSTLRCSVTDPQADTPGLVRALAAAGADILTVAPDTASLEDIYLALVRRTASKTLDDADA